MLVFLAAMLLLTVPVASSAAGEALNRGLIRAEFYVTSSWCADCVGDFLEVAATLDAVERGKLRSDRKVIVHFASHATVEDVAALEEAARSSGVGSFRTLYVVEGTVRQVAGRTTLRLSGNRGVLEVLEALDPMLVGNLERLRRFFSTAGEQRAVIMGPILPSPTNGQLAIAANIFQKPYRISAHWPGRSSR